MSKKTVILLLVFSLIACFVVSIFYKNIVLNKVASVNRLQIDNKNSQDTKNTNKIKKFHNLGELKKFLSKNSSNSLSDSRQRSLFKVDSKINSNAISVNDKLDDKISESVSDYSKTNIQVNGVDEADIVKTDGNYIYTISKGNVFIIKAYKPENSEIVSEIKLKSYPKDIYINGDRLVVYGDDYNTFKHEQSTFLKIFDISDKKNPKQIRDLSFEGNYSDSRMIGDYVYLITNKWTYGYNGANILPKIIDGNTIISNCSNKNNCVFPDVYYFDIPYNSYNFTSVSAINIKDSSKKINNEIYIFSGNQNMYVSSNNIYITYTRHINQYEIKQQVVYNVVYPRLPKEEQEKINKINAVENFILNKHEKLNKVSNILNKYISLLNIDNRAKITKEINKQTKQKIKNLLDELEKTIIYKIAINNGKLQYKASGEVKGYVLNQFSMDEKDGYFRIATTKNREWSQYLDENDKESYSNLYILDKNLKVTGAIEKIARGEAIYSVRFMQNRAYLVTYKQTDPLFVIDLSNPKKPNVLGQLKLPGYSNYLHPYDNNILIGIGKSTSVDTNGGMRTEGIKLSMFDVSDVNNLKEIDSYLIDGKWSNSIALSNHKAFLFSKNKKLLVIPVSINNTPILFKTMNSKDDKISNKSKSFQGVFVFNVDQNGFKLKGKIIYHNQDNKPYYFGGNLVKRSLYIKNALYTVSDQEMKINKLSDLSLIKDIEFYNKNNSFNIIN